MLSSHGSSQALPESQALLEKESNLFFLKVYHIYTRDRPKQSNIDIGEREVAVDSRLPMLRVDYLIIDIVVNYAIYWSMHSHACNNDICIYTKCLIIIFCGQSGIE